MGLGENLQVEISRREWLVAYRTVILILILWYTVRDWNISNAKKFFKFQKFETEA